MDVSSVNPETIYIDVVFVAIGSIISVVRNVAGIWDIYRRKPPIDESLSGENANAVLVVAKTKRQIHYDGLQSSQAHDGT